MAPPVAVSTSMAAVVASMEPTEITADSRFESPVITPPDISATPNAATSAVRSNIAAVEKSAVSADRFVSPVMEPPVVVSVSIDPVLASRLERPVTEPPVAVKDPMIAVERVAEPSSVVRVPIVAVPALNAVAVSELILVVVN